jgi:hypothetical protein
MPKIAFLVVAGLLAATAAHAQTAVPLASRSMVPKSDGCLVDAQTYCASAPQTAGGIRQCLARHTDHLSPMCKSSMNQVRNWNQFHPKMGH